MMGSNMRVILTAPIVFVPETGRVIDVPETSLTGIYGCSY